MELKITVKNPPKDSEAMKRFLRSWKTSLIGVALIAGGAAQAASNPISIADVENGPMAKIVAGVGFITAKDYDVSGKKEFDIS